MVRLLPAALLFVGLALLVAPLSIAEEPAAKPTERIASDEEATAALDTFKTEFRARGLKGDDKLAQRDYAMSELAQLQHPDVVAALGKVAKSSDRTLRVLALIYLGEQRLLPGLAGPLVLKTMKRDAKLPICTISGLQSLGNLRYLGAAKQLKALLEHKDFAVKKATIQAVGNIGEMRLWKEIFKIAGVSVRLEPGADGDVALAADKQEEGKEPVVVEEGYSYEGAEAVVDRNEADNTQENADAKAKVEAKIAENKRAAESKAGKGSAVGGGTGTGTTGAGGGSGVSSGTATGRGAVARSPQELMPFVLDTIYKLTGERFEDTRGLGKWVRENFETIRDRIATLDALEKAQKEDAKKLK